MDFSPNTVLHTYDNVWTTDNCLLSFFCFEEAIKIKNVQKVQIEIHVAVKAVGVIK